MIDQCAALALPADAAPPADWPLPELKVPPAEVAGWRERLGLSDDRAAVAFAPGAVGPSKRWPAAYADVARRLTAQGIAVWVLGGPDEKPLATQIIADAGPLARDLTGTDLRNAILALAAADVAVSNDSGLLHVAAALGTPAVGIFGPTSPWHWAPLNPIAAAVQTPVQARLPAVPQADLPHAPSPLHARHLGRTGAGGDAARARHGADRLTRNSFHGGAHFVERRHLRRARRRSRSVPRRAGRAGPARCRRRSRPAARRARRRDAAGRCRRRPRMRRARSSARPRRAADRSGTRALGTAAAISALRRRSASVPHGSTGA